MAREIGTSKTILFADICGSTALYETLGDTNAFKMVNATLLQLSSITIRHGGTVIKTIGDELMCSFAEPIMGVLSAVEMQQKLNQKSKESHNDISIKIGLHAGEVVKKGVDIFGDTVNTASRLVKIAKQGQIITSEDLINFLDGDAPINFKSKGLFDLKGKKLSVMCFEITWCPDKELTRLINKKDKQNATTLVLRHKDKVYYVNTQKASLSIGRGPHSSIVVNDVIVSHDHAKAEYQKNKFVINDFSTNGTFVVLENGQKVFIKHEGMPLPERGTIHLGSADGSREDVIIYFDLITA